MDNNKWKVMVVEDEDAIRLTIKDYFKKKGYDVLVASDGVGAIKQLIDNDDINIILSDYRMDILGGDYWIKFLQKYCPDKKVIITSGFLRPDFVIPYEVIYKPFDYSDLEKKVRAILTNTNEE